MSFGADPRKRLVAKEETKRHVFLVFDFYVVCGFLYFAMWRKMICPLFEKLSLFVLNSSEIGLFHDMFRYVFWHDVLDLRSSIFR